MEANQRVEALLRQQTALASFGELALRENDLDVILTEACRLVGHALGTDLAKVMELQDDGISLLVRAGVGWHPGVVGMVRIKALAGSSEGLAIRTGMPAISPDIEQDDRFTYPLFLTENGVRGLVNVIILSPTDSSPYGLLQVNSRRPRDFDDHDVTFLKGYANLIGAAVERLRAVRAMQSWTSTLEQHVQERTRSLEQAQQARQHTEDQLRQSQKMEAVGQLTGGLAHDFNNMLAGLMGNLELMQLHLRQGRTDELERYAQVAINVATRAAALTHRLLAFSRRQTLDPCVADLNALLRSMEELLRRTLTPRVHLTLELAPELHACLCDANQVESALLNLALNSRDAMPDGGCLTIQTCNTVVSAAVAASRPGCVPGEYVEIQVIDTGTGMTPETLDHAFEPFFTTKPFGEGSGLGLSMIYGFVKQSNGYLQIESAPGMGTTIHMFLPRFDGVLSHLPAQACAPALPPATGNGTVLLVEDEESVRDMSQEALLEAGFDVIVAENGIQGLEVLQSARHINILVTDVGLPNGMNGHQLATAARQHRPDLAILFITGFAENAIACSAPLASGMQIMTKPFSLTGLIARVHDMIEHRSARTLHMQGTLR